MWEAGPARCCLPARGPPAHILPRRGYSLHPPIPRRRRRRQAAEHPRLRDQQTGWLGSSSSRDGISASNTMAWLLTQRVADQLRSPLFTGRWSAWRSATATVEPEDKVSQYIPGPAGSAGDDVTARQLMTESGRGLETRTTKTPTPTWRNSPMPGQSWNGRHGHATRRHSFPRSTPLARGGTGNTGETNQIGVLVSRTRAASFRTTWAEKILGSGGDGAAGHLAARRNRARDCRLLRAGRDARDYARFGLVLCRTAPLASGSLTSVRPGHHQADGHRPRPRLWFPAVTHDDGQLRRAV